MKMHYSLIIATMGALVNAVAIPSPATTLSPSIIVKPAKSPVRTSTALASLRPNPLASILSAAVAQATVVPMPLPPIVTTLPPPVFTYSPTPVQGNPALSSVLSALVGAPSAADPSSPASIQIETEKKLMYAIAALEAVKEDMLYNAQVKKSLEDAADSVGEDPQSQAEYAQKLAAWEAQIKYDQDQAEALEMKVECLSWMVQPHKEGDEMPVNCMGLGPL